MSRAQSGSNQDEPVGPEGAPHREDRAKCSQRMRNHDVDGSERAADGLEGRGDLQRIRGASGLHAMSREIDDHAPIAIAGESARDAPVLAGADASIAPAHGALLAQTSADIVLVGHDLSPVATAIKLSRQTLKIVRQNLAWAIVYNAAALPLAALGYVPPWAAAIGMSASSLIVVLNALRLNRFGAS